MESIPVTVNPFATQFSESAAKNKQTLKQNLSIILIKPDYFGVKEFPDAVVLLLFCFVMLAHTHTKLSYLLQLLSEMGEYKEAMEVLKKALKLEPATKVRLCGWATSATPVNWPLKPCTHARRTRPRNKENITTQSDGRENGRRAAPMCLFTYYSAATPTFCQRCLQPRDPQVSAPVSTKSCSLTPCQWLPESTNYEVKLSLIGVTGIFTVENIVANLYLYPTRWTRFVFAVAKPEWRQSWTSGASCTSVRLMCSVPCRSATRRKYKQLCQ